MIIKDLGMLRDASGNRGIRIKFDSRRGMTIIFPDLDDRNHRDKGLENRTFVIDLEKEYESTVFE